MVHNTFRQLTQTFEKTETYLYGCLGTVIYLPITLFLQDSQYVPNSDGILDNSWKICSLWILKPHATQFCDLKK